MDLRRARLEKAVRRPDRAVLYAIQQTRDWLRWNYYYRQLRPPKSRGRVPHDPQGQARVEARLRAHGFRVEEDRVDLAGFRSYLARADYGRFPYYGGGRLPNFMEKALEHYLAAKLLALTGADVYLDIASADSPAAEVYRRLYGCQVYQQDLEFPPGLHGRRIGGDAADLPLAPGSISKMALHCSFEHFEGDADSRFIREAGRVLRPGGRLCILPLYLFDDYAVMTDPLVARGRVPFEPDAVLYCAKNYGNRHGRFYDVPHLLARIKSHLGDLRLTIYVVRNEKEADPSCYLKFIALLEK